MKTAEQVKKEIEERYNRKPDGWTMEVTMDEDHNLTWRIRRDRQVWMIKEFNVNPYKVVGVGGRIKDSVNKTVNPIISFGLRPVTEEHIADVLSAQTPQEQLKKTANIMLKIAPTPAPQLDSEYVLHGPILQKPKSLQDLSYKQRVLSLKLKREILKLKREKYPHLVGLYG